MKLQELTQCTAAPVRTDPGEGCLLEGVPGSAVRYENELK